MTMKKAFIFFIGFSLIAASSGVKEAERVHDEALLVEQETDDSFHAPITFTEND